MIDKHFSISRYGIYARLADIADSEFILSLRTNKELSKFIHSTENDLTKQIAWMKEYKIREEKGLDYYFIYQKNGDSFALNRIYDITNVSGTAGSWISKPGTDPEDAIASLLLLRDIMFEELDLEFDYFDVRKGNKHVQRIHKMMGAVQVNEDELNYYFELHRNVYFEKREEIFNLLNIK